MYTRSWKYLYSFYSQNSSGLKFLVPKNRDGASGPKNIGTVKHRDGNQDLIGGLENRIVNVQEFLN